jgi:hypothetical protein
MIFVLSLTRGMRSQTFCIEAKILAFFGAAMRRGEVTGRNSATGWPRLSITVLQALAVAAAVMNFSRSALMVSASVVGMPCGKFL